MTDEPGEDAEKPVKRRIPPQNSEAPQNDERVDQNPSSANLELQQKDRELASASTKLQATIESTANGILVTDMEGKVTACNDKFLRMWQLPRTAMNLPDHQTLALNFQSLKDSAQHLERLKDIYASWPVESLDLLELSDQRVFERSSYIQVVDSRRIGRLWIFRDITQRKRAEEAQQDKQHVLETLNRFAAMTASTLDLQTLLQSITDAATNLSGAEFGACFFIAVAKSGELRALSGAPREDMNEFGQRLVKPLSGQDARSRQPIRSGDVLTDPSFSESGIRGSDRVRSYLAVPLMSRSGEVSGGLFLTHSEAGMFDARIERILVAAATGAAGAIDNALRFKAAQAEAEERGNLLGNERSARAAAERMGELKDDFLANLSHELRTPLSAIVGWSKVLRRGIKDEADLQNGLESIERNARIQTQLIEDLLDMNHIASGRVCLNIQPAAPVLFIEAAIDSIRTVAAAKGIQIEKVLDAAAAPIAGDLHRLQQVVWRLLSNAIKFSAAGGKVQVLLVRVDSGVEITVVDHGIGIRQEFQPHVFERFHPDRASANRRYEGLGLGLSIVKQLVELHGGTVRVSSEGEGRGAAFSVQFPLLGTNRETLSYPSPQAASTDFSAVNLQGIKVLVVDDESDARNLIRRVLLDCNAEVLTAASASDALQLIERQRPDVLVSDIGMPDVDGYELLRRVRALEPARGGKMPAIALTAFARSEDRTRALRAGFVVHISKPVEPAELVATVASVAGRNS